MSKKWTGSLRGFAGTPAARFAEAIEEDGEEELAEFSISHGVRYAPLLRKVMRLGRIEVESATASSIQNEGQTLGIERKNKVIQHKSCGSRLPWPAFIAPPITDEVKKGLVTGEARD
jgi:hypothetical protein